MEQAALRPPRNFRPTELKAAGVTLIDPIRTVLRCDDCDAQWSPMLGERARLPRRYWQCPNGCNVAP